MDTEIDFIADEQPEKAFAGIVPPVPTPFVDDHIALNHFAENLARLHEYALGGYLILGSNGEANFLSEREKLDLLRIAWAETPREKVLLAGTGLESTAATCEFTKKVADCGVDAALVLTPGFYRPTTAGLRAHFEAVADASPIPILLYNVPKYTGINLPVECALELIQHPNIIGMKDSAGELGQLVELNEKLPDDAALFLGSDKVLLAGLAHGVSGGILAIANIIPQQCIDLYRAVQEGNMESARTIANRIAPVGRILIGKYGVPGLKAGQDHLGLSGGKPRLPLLSLDEKQREEIAAVLDKALNVDALKEPDLDFDANIKKI